MKTLSSQLKHVIETTKPKSKKQRAFELAISICQDVKELKEAKI